MHWFVGKEHLPKPTQITIIVFRPSRVVTHQRPAVTIAIENLRRLRTHAESVIDRDDVTFAMIRHHQILD